MAAPTPTIMAGRVPATRRDTPLPVSAWVFASETHPARAANRTCNFPNSSVIITDMEADTPHPASPPDPPQDQPGKTMPEHIAFLLQAARMLLGYGRHLLATVQRRAAAPTFPTIAAAFGTANLATIRAHLNRGLLRAAALERFLLERAATAATSTS
jgi:hypothetical protein